MMQKNWKQHGTKNIVILIDTNVIIDYLLERQPFTASASKVMQKCREKEITGCIAAHSITNAFYILRKDYSPVERKQLLSALCDLVDVVGISKQHILNAIGNENFDDIEDYLQFDCAQSVRASYIITRNINDFSESPIPALSTNDFLKNFRFYS